MKSELSAVTRRDTNKLTASTIQQLLSAVHVANNADAVSGQKKKIIKKVTKKKCKLLISPNRKGFKTIPKIQSRCNSNISVQIQSMLVYESSNDSAKAVRDVSRTVTGGGKLERILKLHSNQIQSPCLSSLAHKSLEKSRQRIKRSPLRSGGGSPNYSPMKDAFEKHRREAAAFMKLKSSEINYLKVTVYRSICLNHED